ncbi:thiopeptide-type bacteriocin biosynthesis domain-containing protein [Hydrobacter penzbergensis]|uniref:Thiopeptide-type bacteriocin biosynthesis domain-containing protein n=2 Tax=Pseudomonadati TaxID=3379134 RepID=A0A8X8LBL5_9BACT|nr:lantibiotic dehydratase [Hydrobacter penzbergensis]SDX01309.1 thiopeptide-type bacteriocin biosynthesis domain-containing protein [Hydrobacter penzbergensis]
MYTHFSKVLLRSPLQSLLKVQNIDPVDKLGELFKIGLYLSSPEFLSEFEGISGRDDKKKTKLHLSLIKYWIRSCIRPTPYGTFAGCSLVDISDANTVIKVAPQENHIIKVRLDMNFVVMMVKAITLVPEIQSNILYHVNNSLYELDGEYRFAEYHFAKESRIYFLTEVEKSPSLKVLLKKAQNGATINELMSIVTECDPELEKEEVFIFIMELINAQILIADIEPCVTGDEPLAQLIKKLELSANNHSICNKLKEVQNLTAKPIISLDYYHKIENLLKGLDLNLEFPKNTIQADLYLAFHESNFNSALMNQLCSQINDLKGLTKSNSNADLNTFKENFKKRYDEQEIPLVIALDSDLGIGYSASVDRNNGGSEYIDDLAVTNAEKNRPQRSWDESQYFSLKLYEKYIRSQADSIEISEEDIKAHRFRKDSSDFAKSLFIMGHIFRKNEEHSVDPENFMFWINGIGGSSAANLLGRFAHGDNQIENFVKTILEEEERRNPDCIYAEIVHLPNARTGNVLLRPVLRNYEIPYVGKSGASLENQIHITDLYVSIKRDKVILRSRRLDKEIIPRLTTAHNFSANSLPIYKFLCDIQLQNELYPAIWSWGGLEELKYLPRVTYKNIILKRARWLLDDNLIINLSSNEVEFFRKIRNNLSLPQVVVLAEGDNELLIDFENIDHIRLFIQSLKKNKQVRLEEFLFTNKNCIVTDNMNQPYTSEIILPLIESRETILPIMDLKGLMPPKKINEKIIRSFFPNEDWLYLKIYAGKKSSEKILVDFILPFIRTNDQLFHKFFFIRYQDEIGSHIRLRFLKMNSKNSSILFQKLMETLRPLMHKTIYKITTDVYERELERYSSIMIEESETIFFNSSSLILKLISLLEENEEGDKFRIFFALRIADALLNDFKIPLSEKYLLLSKMRDSFVLEFDGDINLNRELNNKYRVLQKEICSAMDEKNDESNGLLTVRKLLQTRSASDEIAINNIISKSGRNKDILFHLLPSFIHMEMNRLFPGQQRKFELLIYALLERYYYSLSARIKQNDSLPT